jgi:hypothetical protein
VAQPRATNGHVARALVHTGNGLALTPVISADGLSRRVDGPLRSRCRVTVVAVNGIV